MKIQIVLKTANPVFNVCKMVQKIRRSLIGQILIKKEFQELCSDFIRIFSAFITENEIYYSVLRRQFVSINQHH